MRDFYVKQHENERGDIITTIEGYDVGCIDRNREPIYYEESDDSGIIEDLFENLPHNSAVFFGSGVYEVERVEFTSANIMLTSIPAMNKSVSTPVIKAHKFLFPKWSTITSLELQCGEIVCEKVFIIGCILREVVVSDAIVSGCNIFNSKISGGLCKRDLVIDRSNIFDSDLRCCDLIEGLNNIHAEVI